MTFFAVGCGGALGAMARYALSLVPVGIDFPLITLITNFLGAILIGIVTGLAEIRGLSPQRILFWKTGVCGGFTTFSTFSLETVRLFHQGQPLKGGFYIMASVVLCGLGVLIGTSLARFIK